MKLQMNDRGSWREVVEFAPGQIREIKAATLHLARALGPGNALKGRTWRITADGRSALFHLERPYGRWTQA